MSVPLAIATFATHAAVWFGAGALRIARFTTGLPNLTGLALAPFVVAGGYFSWIFFENELSNLPWHGALHDIADEPSSLCAYVGALYGLAAVVRVLCEYEGGSGRVFDAVLAVDMLWFVAIRILVNYQINVDGIEVYIGFVQVALAFAMTISVLVAAHMTKAGVPWRRRRALANMFVVLTSFPPWIVAANEVADEVPWHFLMWTSGATSLFVLLLAPIVRVYYKMYWGRIPGEEGSPPEKPVEILVVPEPKIPEPTTEPQAEEPKLEPPPPSPPREERKFVVAEAYNTERKFSGFGAAEDEQ